MPFAATGRTGPFTANPGRCSSCAGTVRALCQKRDSHQGCPGRREVQEKRPSFVFRYRPRKATSEVA